MVINEIGESPGYLIEGLSRNMRRFSSQILRKRKAGLTLEQTAVLIILMQKGAIHQGELAEIMSKDNPTLTRILDLLENKTYLKRDVSPVDRRKFLIVLTNQGRKKLKEALPIIQEIRRTLFENFSPEQLDQLKRMKALIETNILNSKS